MKMKKTLAACILALAANTGSAFAAEGLTLLRPADGETIHDNDGRVAVLVTGAPDAEGFQAYVDGAQVGGTHRGPAFHLEGIERGEHRLSVTAVDDRGRAVATSEAITVYMWQASRLFQPRR
jgi:penicillin-binding protein